MPRKYAVEEPIAKILAKAAGSFGLHQATRKRLRPFIYPMEKGRVRHYRQKGAKTQLLKQIAYRL